MAVELAPGASVTEVALSVPAQPDGTVRARLKLGEDHQLAFYGLLSDAPIASASYVALEPSRDRAGDAEAPRYAESQEALMAHILASMQAIAGGAPLPANGVETICQYCDVRGLCRKGAW